MHMKMFSSLLPGSSSPNPSPNKFHDELSSSQTKGFLIQDTAAAFMEAPRVQHSYGVDFILDRLVLERCLITA